MPAVVTFPTALSSYGAPFTGSALIPQTLGTVYFVSSVIGFDTYPGTDPTMPLATIGAAVLKATSTTADVIVVMPGHAETLSGAGALTINKIGVSIVGLGNGTQRPKLTLSTTSTTIAVSAANVLLRNIVITTSVDAVVKVFNVTAAGLWLDAVDFAETAACACLNFVTTSSAATDLTITNCKWVNSQTQSTGAQQWILLTAAQRFKCLGCYASLNGVAAGANGIIVGVTTATLDVLIANNWFQTVGSVAAVPISMLAASTGLIANNFVASAKTAIAGSVACANCYAQNNYACHIVNKSGLLDPVVDA